MRGAASRFSISPIDLAGCRKKGKAPYGFVLDNGSIRVALSTAGGSFTSIVADGREYLWQGDPAVWSGPGTLFASRSAAVFVTVAQ